MNWTLLGLFLFFCFPVSAALPPEAQNYLNQIPERKLTLPFVIQRALENADAYRVIGLDFLSAGLEERSKIDPQTDVFLTGGADYTDDNSAKTNGFQAVRSKQSTWNLGLSKGWSTGTKTSLGWSQEIIDSEFADLGLGDAFITNFKQSVATIGLEQNLLKDSFGYAFRRRREATQKRGQSIQWETRNQFESTTLGIINAFYSAWLLQQQVMSLREQVARQTRLVKILSVRAKKGAVEKPDLIQIEALLASLKTRLAQVKARLVSQWDELVIQLKLPESFLQLDPMDVPTRIDNPVPLSLRVCGRKEPEKTASIHALEKNLESLDADYKASENESLPDLKLVAGYRGNSIDGSAGTNFENVLRGQDNVGFGQGPTWNVGLQLSVPLNNSGARAERAKNFINREKTSSQLISAVDNLKVQWRDTCRRLRVEWDNSKVYKNVVAEQKKRVQGQERRFRLGRVTVNDLVVAEDDLGSWQFQNQQKSIEVRQLAWLVQQYSGELYRYLEPAIEAKLKEASP